MIKLAAVNDLNANIIPQTGAPGRVAEKEGARRRPGVQPASAPQAIDWRFAVWASLALWALIIGAIVLVLS